MTSIIDSIRAKFANSKYAVLSSEEIETLIGDSTRPVYRNQWETPGHFYSPIPDINDVLANADKIFLRPENVRTIPGVELNHELQLSHMREFFRMGPSLPFPEEKNGKTRYHYNNHSYSYADAITLHSMIRMYKPKRIIEIGSGFSSCVMADTNELFFNNSIDLTFIEPNPEFFFSVLPQSDRERFTVHVSKVQDVDLKVFDALEENDILFIDSSHVSKIGSDVNQEFFEIIPRLKKGVIIHVHDIFHPFEYPYDWVMDGRAMNENYLLRAFLQYNESFQVLFISTYACNFFRDEIEKNLPIFLKNSGGDFWMKRIK
jgi:predicted O-methyltransferase YrrM